MLYPFFVSINFLALLASTTAAEEPQVFIDINNCSLNELLCYTCDSTTDPNCGSTFKFSHYYVSGIDYTTSCYGCCVKIVDSTVDGQEKVIRACTESLPASNFSINHDCDDKSDYKNKRKVCLCEKDLCNGANNVSKSILTVLLIPLLVIYQYSY